MSKNKIAQHLNRSHSTIIREIKRNTDKRGYRYNQADGKAMAVFYKIVKLAKNGVLMIIHIYAKVSTIKPATNLFRRTIKQMALHSKDIKPKVNL
jgi:IS30 family transposase